MYFTRATLGGAIAAGAVTVASALGACSAGDHHQETEREGVLPNSAATATPSSAAGEAGLEPLPGGQHPEFPALVLPGEVTARVGDPFAKTDGTPRLLNFLDAETGQYPMRAVERGIIVQRHRRYQSDDGYFEYVLWDPSSGAERLLWTAPPRKQDMISAGEGDLVVVVRTGMSMPFPEWAMSLRNIATGEERMIAMGDPDLLRTRGLRITLPLGFAPMPSMSGGKVAWAEFGLGASGPEKHVRIYDVEMGSTSTIATLSDAREELLWSPSIGGDRVAWFTAKGMGETVYLVVHELGTGKELRFSVPGAPFDGKLSGDGRYFAWDDGFTAKYALELASGEVTRFANDEGDQTEVSGHYVSWHPKRGAGFYDFESRTVRFSERGGGGAASVLGKWFYWREFVIVNGEEDKTRTAYYFIELEP